MSVKVFGHQSPDTDTITSAIVYAHILTSLGIEATAYRLGEINKETEYALSYFNVEVPELLEEITAGDRVALVDHNEFSQSVQGIEQGTIISVIDHHKVANFETAEPLHMRLDPVGCTATILYEIIKEESIEITKELAGLMVSAIISDTLLFKSPTCTKRDVRVGKELAERASIVLETYGMDLLKASTDLSGKTTEELLNLDAKIFPFEEEGVRIKINQINAVDVDEVYENRIPFEEGMMKEISEHELSLYLLVVTDIVESNSTILALGERTDLVEQAFDVTLNNGMAVLEGVVSRKKQIVPALTTAVKG